MIYHNLPICFYPSPVKSCVNFEQHDAQVVQVTSHHILAHGVWSVHGEMQHWLMLLPGGFSLPRQEIKHQVPGNADHSVAPHHVVSGHHQVIAMGQVPEGMKEGLGRRMSKEPDS